LFSRYGEIINTVVISSKRKALIEYRLRLSAEKAY